MDKIHWVCYRGVFCFILLVRLHLLPKVLRGNDQSSTEFKSKRMVSFAEESGKYKLIECKGDSSVPESTANGNKHYMICSTTKLMYTVLQIRVAKCLCSISIVKEGMKLMSCS